MITIDKDIKITIDKADVPVFNNICELARHYLAIKKSLWLSDEQLQEVCKFLNIIDDGVKL